MLRQILQQGFEEVRGERRKCSFVWRADPVEVQNQQALGGLNARALDPQQSLIRESANDDGLAGGFQAQ